MRLYYDLDIGGLVSQSGYNKLLASLSFKRGDTHTIEMQFVRGSTIVGALDGTVSEMIFAVKTDYEEATAPMLLASNFTYDATDELYKSLIASDSAAILTYLAGANYKAAKGEFTFTTDTLGTDSSQELSAILHNDVWKGGELSPVAIPTADDDWLAHGHPQSLNNAQKEQAHANMGWPAYDDLTAANAALAPGKPYYDRALEGPNITSA